MPKKSPFPLILALCVLCAGCAMTSGGQPTLEQRVEQQDIQLRQMRPQQADTMNQLEAMRNEINELKGQVRNLKSAAGMPVEPEVPASGLSQTPYAPESSAYGAERTVVPVPAEQTAAETGNYGLEPAPVEAQPRIPDGYAVVQPPSEETWGKEDPRPALVVPQKDVSLALFDAGVNSYNARDYAAAQRSFSEFVKNYPQHSQIAEARYYLAECQFQRNHFPEAALAYDTVIKNYPKSSSAPGAYLKQAISFSKMNQPAAAKARMQEIISKFPNSPEATRARNFLKTNK